MEHSFDIHSISGYWDLKSILGSRQVTAEELAKMMCHVSRKLLVLTTIKRTVKKCEQIVPGNRQDSSRYSQVIFLLA
jgi:hypothetical protein